MYRLPFISIPSEGNAEGTSEWVRDIGAGLASGAIVPMLGPQGSGKSRILEQVTRNGVGNIGPDQIVFVRMPKHLEKANRKKLDVATPITTVLFWRLLYVLRKRVWMGYSELGEDDKWRAIVMQDDAPVYGKNDLSVTKNRGRDQAAIWSIWASGEAAGVELPYRR